MASTTTDQFLVDNLLVFTKITMGDSIGVKMISRTISHYKILEKLGQSGMPVPLKRGESGRFGL
jgi:hypothetical protein